MGRSMKVACTLMTLLGASAMLPAKAQNAQNHFLGEIILTGGVFCPGGTIPADGRLLPITQNTALFSLMGTTYGGDGQTNFALPKVSGLPTQTGPLQVCIVSKGVYPTR